MLKLGVAGSSTKSPAYTTGRLRFPAGADAVALAAAAQQTMAQSAEPRAEAPARR